MRPKSYHVTTAIPVIVLPIFLDLSNGAKKFEIWVWVLFVPAIKHLSMSDLQIFSAPAITSRLEIAGNAVQVVTIGFDF